MKQKNRIQNILAASIILLYGVCSFFRLGSRYAPSTAWTSTEKGSVILLDFGEEKEIRSLNFYLGNYEERRFSVQVGRGEPVIWETLPEITVKRVYQWGNIPLNTKGQFLKLTALNQLTEIRELVIKDRQGAAIFPVNKAEYPRLFDESWMYPGYGSFQSGTVFDESLFARTAYEQLHGLRSYEDTHPPLGKSLIAIGIACFGMNPFGWRAAGVVAGILLLVVLWAFSLRLFEDSWTSVGVLLLLALDFLHFTQSRLGQVDSFLVLFMTVMYYFMFRYYEVMVEGDKKKSWRYLWGSGLFLGLAASCKWSGLYGGVGLGVIWLYVMVRGKLTIKEIGKTCGVCCLAFLVVPILIYLLSYLPYVAFDETLGFWERMRENQVNMFQYHAYTGTEHELASRWFQWPVIGKPVKLFSVWFGNGEMENLILMGNPAFWWPGLVILAACFSRLVERFEGRLAFLLIGYLAPFLPWIVISRYSFLYHYYPSIPFLALIMGYWAEKQGKRGKWCLFLCAGASAVLFILFYPIISGLRIPMTYAARWLEWVPFWNFTS